MCVILDANRMGDYINEGKDKGIKQLRIYVEKGKLKLVKPKGSFLSEYKRNHDFFRLFKKYDEKGYIKSISNYRYNQAEEELRKLKNKNKVVFKSNKEDIPILALALAARAKLLVTNDRALREDFTNSQIIGGSVYKDQEHLLANNNCPN